MFSNPVTQTSTDEQLFNDLIHSFIMHHLLPRVYKSNSSPWSSPSLRHVLWIINTMDIIPNKEVAS